MEMKHIRIGGIPYEIVFQNGLMDDANALGHVEFEKQRITIDPSLPPERMAQTIVHEVMHAVFYEAGIADQDEDLVNQLAIAWWRMICETDDGFYEDIRTLSDGIRLDEYQAAHNDTLAGKVEAIAKAWQAAFDPAKN
jgi:hypothetical protein